MNKMVLICLAAVVCVIGATLVVNWLPANQEPAQEMVQVIEIPTVEGLIVEVSDGYFVMQDAVQGEIQVNFSSETAFEGVSAQELEFGQYVFVNYDGKMTRSLPPQIAGERVAMYPVSGRVTALETDRVTIEQENGQGEAIVFLPEGAPQLTLGNQITAYTNGAMTMSLPPQTTALHVEVTE